MSDSGSDKAGTSKDGKSSQNPNVTAESEFNVKNPSRDGKAHNVQITLSQKKVFANDDDDIEVEPDDDISRRSKGSMYNKPSTLSMALSDSFRFQSFNQDRSSSNMTRTQRFKLFLYNKHEESVCGRNRMSWLKILSYYILFMAGNVLLFLLFIYLLDQSDLAASPFESKSNLYSDALPGFTFVPCHLKTTAANLLTYTTKGKNSKKSIDNIINLIDDFMKEQDKQCKQAIQIKHCSFNRTSLGPCSTRDYGYESNKPCVFIKLNNLHKWLPRTYDEVSNIPKNTPDEIKKLIDVKSRKVWVHCYGMNKLDQEMLGPIKYHPTQYFHNHYFPVDAEARFNPLLAIQFEGIQTGRIIQIQCKLYAANIGDIENNRQELFIYIK